MKYDQELLDFILKFQVAIGCGLGVTKYVHNRLLVEAIKKGRYLTAEENREIIDGCQEQEKLIKT